MSDARTAPKLDAVDLRILDAVRRNGRLTKAALAEAVGLSPTPCWLRLRKLEQAGIVIGYHARVAVRRIAPIAGVLLEVTLAGHRAQDFDRFERAVLSVPEIVACWSVGGGVDYILKVMARDIDAYQRLIDGLLERDLGIMRYFTYVITKTVKDEDGPPARKPAPAAGDLARPGFGRVPGRPFGLSGRPIWTKSPRDLA